MNRVLWAIGVCFRPCLPLQEKWVEYWVGAVIPLCALDSPADTYRPASIILSLSIFMDRNYILLGLFRDLTCPLRWHDNSDIVFSLEVGFAQGAFSIMLPTNSPLSSTLPRDLTSGLVVFLVAVPLCLGIALASGAPLLSGVLAGIVGGILVGTLSGSHTSVSGPAAGLTVIVAAQIVALGSFPSFLLAVVLAGLIQIGLGLARAGFIAAFFPTSVIKGLLAAIGVILILKQIPHLFGHDADPEGDEAFQQPDHENTFSELVRTIGDIHPSAAAIGLVSIAVLVVWASWKPLKNSVVPAPLIVVLLGVGISQLFRQLGGDWVIEPSHLVQVPVADSLAGFIGFLQLPDFSQWSNPAVYTAAVTLAAVASLETLLCLEAVDKLDPQQRTFPREPGTARPGDRERDCRADRWTSDDFCDYPQFREYQRRRQDETRNGRPRRFTAGQRCVPADVAEHDPSVLPGGDPRGHGGQAGQPSSDEADVERGAVPVRPLRSDGGGHRPD